MLNSRTEILNELVRAVRPIQSTRGEKNTRAKLEHIFAWGNMHSVALLRGVEQRKT